MQTQKNVYDELKKEQNRLAKLWNAYKMQEKELEAYRKRLAGPETRKPELKVDELTKKYEKEKERLNKLYLILDDIELELKIAKKEISDRDSWFLEVEPSLRKIVTSINKRSGMIKVTPKPMIVKPRVSKKRRSRRKK